MLKTFFALVIAFAIVLGSFAQTSEYGIIQELAGEVELKPPGAGGFVPARAGDRVSLDTIISTGFRGTAIIMVGNSLITLRPLTRLSLAEISASSERENLSVNLRAGQIKVDVKPPAGTRTDFSVQSPVAVASVRGTEFDFDSRSLEVSEGKVFFRGSRGMEVIVTAGLGSYVGNDERAVDPSVIIATTLRPPPPVGTEFYNGPLLPRMGGEFTATPEY